VRSAPPTLPRAEATREPWAQAVVVAQALLAAVRMEPPRFQELALHPAAARLSFQTVLSAVRLAALQEPMPANAEPTPAA